VQIRQQRRSQLSLNERAVRLAHFVTLEFLHPLRLAADERRHGHSAGEGTLPILDAGIAEVLHSGDQKT